MRDVISQLVQLRAHSDKTYCIDRLNDVLNDLAEGAPTTATNGNAQPSRRTHAMLMLMRLRNGIRQSGEALELKIRWDEAIAAAREFEKQPDGQT